MEWIMEDRVSQNLSGEGLHIFSKSAEFWILMSKWVLDFVWIQNNRRRKCNYSSYKIGKQLPVTSLGRCLPNLDPDPLFFFVE